jgi:hypothetical protein
MGSYHIPGSQGGTVAFVAASFFTIAVFTAAMFFWFLLPAIQEHGRPLTPAETRVSVVRICADGTYIYRYAYGKFRTFGHYLVDDIRTVCPTMRLEAPAE